MNITNIKGTVYRYQSCSSTSEHCIITDILIHEQHIDLAPIKEYRVSFSAKKLFPCNMLIVINF